MTEEDPFALWSKDTNPPKEDEQRRDMPLYTETEGEDGEVTIQIFPSPMARQFAAVIAGQYKALLDTSLFTSEQAFQLVMKSMIPVVFHNHEDDDDDEDN